MTNERIDQSGSPLQAPTDPRIAEDLRQAAVFLIDCRGTEPADIFEDHAKSCRQAADALSQLQQRVEQLTAERDNLLDDATWRHRWHDRLGRGNDTEGTFYARLEAAKEAAESTIASLREHEAETDRRITLLPRTKFDGVDWVNLAAVLLTLRRESHAASLPSSSAVSRTAERQDYGPDPNCKRCGGTGEAPNAQFKCPCRWQRR